MNKTYIKVIAEFDEDGRITPLKVIWTDGRKYKITQIIDIRRAASLKAGGTSYRYTVKINGMEKYIWIEDVVFNKTIGAKWFVEEK